MGESKTRRWVRAGGFLVLAAWLAWQLDATRLLAAVEQLWWPGWLGALAVFTAIQVVNGWRWQLLARPLGFDNRLTHYVSFTYIGMFFNLVLPTSVGGDVVRVWYLDAGGGRRWLAFASVFSERVNGLAALVLLSALGVLVAEVPDWIKACVWASIAALALGGVLVLLAGRIARLEGTRIGRLAARFHAIFRTYADRPLLMTLVTLLSLFGQALGVVVAWLLTESLNLHVPLSYCFVLTPLITLLTLLPFSLNGVGLREAGLVVLLAPLGVTPEQAVTLGLLWLALLLVGGACGGGFYVLGRFPRFHTGQDDTVTRSHDTIPLYAPAQPQQERQAL